MKKIYILTAVFALLAMSLNAQTMLNIPKANGLESANKGLLAPIPSNNSTTGKFNAPMKANLADDEYILGPYTSDAYNSSGWGLTNNVSSLSSAAIVWIGVDINLSEYQDYLGDEIVGYRFATIGQSFVYDVFIYPMSETYLSGDNAIFWEHTDSEGYPSEFSTGWHEYRLDTPVEFTFPDSIQSFWLGYRYYQFESSSSYNKTPVGYNSSSTSHMDRMYWNNGFYNMQSYIGGDIAVQLIMRHSVEKTPTPTITVTPGDASYTITATAADPTAAVTLTIDGVDYTGTGSVSHTINRGSTDQTVAVSATAQEDGKAVSDPATQNVTVPALPKTATPTITYEVTATQVIITASGNGTVHLEADGQTAEGQGSAVIIITRTPDERTVTATATAQETGKLVSDPATETITIPEAGRSPQPTITFTDNGDGTYTITVTGTGEVTVYIDDAEHGDEPIAVADQTFSFTVEQHSQTMTITVSATNKEGELEVSRPATETYTIPAMTIDDDFKLLDPQPANADTPIDLSKIMFVDRFSVDIPSNNSHPFKYEYTLEETQVRQRSSNSVDVYAEHTGSNGKGFYTLSQIDNDTTASLEMNVRNAAMDFNLSELSAPFFYTVEREEESEGETYWGWNAILQRTSVGNYKQTLKYDTKGNLLYNYNDTIFPGEHIQLDLDTITGSYNDYNAYVPVVWTMGFDRVNYNEDDPVHNSYGASVWTTGVAEVTMDTENAPLARVQRGWNTKWSDNNGEKCSLFMLDNVWATATMPTVNTLDYEPYMFRIFVKSKENKLRPYKYVEKDGNTVITAGEGTTNGPICVWNGYINDPDNAHKGVEISYTPGDEDHGMTITFNKNRVIREDANDDWTLSDENAMFGALESIAVSGYDSNGDPVLHDISTDDLEVFVRFYYIVEGIAEGHTPWAPTRDGNGDGEGPAGYGAESDPGGAGVATSVSEVRYHGEVVSKTYYNVQGIKSEQPFSGVNIVVTRYSDGATVVTKVMK